MIGNLLTPIFRYHDIDVTTTECIDQLDLFDEDYFKRAFILKPGFKYQFFDRDGVTKYCKLPAPSLTSLTSLANVEFLPAEEFLCTVVSKPRPKGTSTRASTSRPHLEDDTVPQTFAPQDTYAFQEHTEQLIPDYTGEYALSPITDDASDRDRLAWIVESTKKNNSMMEKMWGALAKLRCPRPPSCFRAAETTELDADDPDTTGDPVVAGRGDTTPPTRFRRRKIIGESQSGTSESDHGE